MAQEHVNKNKPKQSEEETEKVEAKDLTNDELDSDVDDLLADIDDALGDLTDEETQEFVENYRQQGGE